MVGDSSRGQRCRLRRETVPIVMVVSYEETFLRAVRYSVRTRISATRESNAFTEKTTTGRVSCTPAIHGERPDSYLACPGEVGIGRSHSDPFRLTSSAQTHVGTQTAHPFNLPEKRARFGTSEACSACSGTGVYSQENVQAMRR